MCRLNGSSHTRTAGFISAWDEKYRSVLIRPETYIEQYIDEAWTPILQTPPFPEYTSAHSVISATASVALTKLRGDNFDFVDSTEVEFGMGPRSFKSFFEASEEAAISRMYGGIHYLPACEIRKKQGHEIRYFIEPVFSKLFIKQFMDNKLKLKIYESKNLVSKVLIGSRIHPKEQKNSTGNDQFSVLNSAILLINWSTSCC